jgi:hypothetical protein
MPGFLTSRLRKYGRIKIWHFKSFSLWYFVMAAQEIDRVGLLYVTQPS